MAKYSDAFRLAKKMPHAIGNCAQQILPAALARRSGRMAMASDSEHDCTIMSEINLGGASI